MFDSRFFSNTYDLYRPTITTADTGAQTVTEPSSATSSSNPCHYVPKPGVWRMGEAGPDLEYDARILIPADQTLRPEKRGQQPDHVLIDSRSFVVMICWDAANQGLYKHVLLKERRT